MSFEFSLEKSFTDNLPRDGFIQNYLQKTLLSPLNAFTARPGKGLRSQLVMLGFQSCKPSTTFSALKACCQIIESLHLGSIIIDDIQDNSKERREGPSFHLTAGLPSAINSGTWLYFWALKQVHALPVSKEDKFTIIESIHKCLFEGHLGQALDIGNHIESIPKNNISELCKTTSLLKSGALTGLSLKIGAVLASANEETQKLFYNLGCELGLILQSYDDLKNLKIKEDLVIDKNKKAFEDLVNGRPNLLWAFAAENCDDIQFQKLKSSLEELPQLKSLKLWQDENQFHKVSLNQLSVKSKSLLNHCREIQSSQNLIDNFSDQINGIIMQLETAYENA